LYYLSLAILFGLAIPRLSVGASPLPANIQLPYFLYLQNWIAFTHYQGFLAQYWSLAVEEQFYLLWPLLLYRSKPRRLLRIVAGLFVFCMALRFILVSAPVNTEFIYRNLLTRMDSLLAGAFCACIVRENRFKEAVLPYCKYLWIAPLLTLAGLRVCSNSFNNHSALMQKLGYSLLALSYAGLLMSLVATMGQDSALQALFKHPLLAFFGKYSYGAYIWHPLVAKLVPRLIHSFYGPLSPAGAIPINIAATFAVSVLSYHAFEHRFLLLRPHFRTGSRVYSKKFKDLPARDIG
jgi:peptidoglycan/LPS O-acetylase OafA/YrhL